MARPKGSKNKTAVEHEEVAQAAAPAVPFNYEEDDAKFDSNYQNRFDATAAYALSMPSVGQFDPVYMPINEANTFKMPENIKLFLVEGEVQLASRAPGRGAMVAKQLRLVEALNEEQAINKYVNYFRSLSDDQSVYTVINAAAMETIR